MKIKIKRAFMVLVISLMVMGALSPALSAQTATYETFEYGTYRLMYGNGVDDDGDGIIDNVGEDDVTFGTESVNASTYVTGGWATTFEGIGTESFTLDKGVIASAHAEALWEIKSSNNASVAPTASCYYTSLIPATSLGYTYVDYATQTNVLPVVSFTIQPSSTDIMNGCQEFWYRSPLAWDESIFITSGNVPYHYLNIYRVSDDELIYASPDIGKGTPSEKLMADNSTGSSGYKRVYYKIDCPIYSDTKYRFEEYVKTIGDQPVNSVKIWVCNLQDIMGDGLTDLYVFKGTSQARALPTECSFGIIFTCGIGPLGTENPVYGRVGGTYQRINAQPVMGGTEDGVDFIRIVFPMRTTIATQVKVGVYVVQDGDLNDFEEEHFTTIEDATGTVIVEFNITDPGSGANIYYPYFEFRDVTGADNVVVYNMYPSDGATHVIQNQKGIAGNTEYVNNFAVQYEIYESTNAKSTADTSEGTVDWVYFLLGIAVWAVGFLITMVSYMLVPILGPLVWAGVAVGSAIGLTGTMMAIHALEGGHIEDFITWLETGAIRVLRAIYDGINWITGGLLDVIVGIIKAIIHLGELALYYGALILEAVWNIIWFVAFVIVLWLTAKFLGVLTDVAEMRYGSALREMQSIAGGGRMVLNKTVGAGVRTAMALKGGAESAYVKGGPRRRLIRYRKEMRSERERQREEDEE